MTENRDDAHDLLEKSLDLARRQRSREALEVALRASELDPQNPQCYALIGVLYRSQGDPCEALGYLRQAVALAPNDSGLQVNLANALSDAGELSPAIACYRRALELSARSAEAHFGLGNAFALCGETAEAIAHYRACVRISPNYSKALYNLGILLQERGDLREAASCLERVRRLEPRSGSTLLQLGAVLCALGKIERASVVWTQLAECALEEDARTSRTAVQHGIEQIGYLKRTASAPLAANAPEQSYAEIGRLLERGEESRAAAAWTGLVYELDGAKARGGGQLVTQALSASLEAEAIEASFARQAIPVAYVDGILSGPALESLRRTLLDSVIWHSPGHEGEVIATLFSGLACPLLLQIAEELRGAFPRILGTQHLISAWAYRYMSDRSVVGPHADTGEVSVNIWITADGASESKTGGGLRFWNKRAPKDYLSRQVEEQRSILASILAAPDTESFSVDYRCNRACIFDSLAIHATDPFCFAQEFEARRVNLTLSFGRLGRSSSG